MSAEEKGFFRTYKKIIQDYGEPTNGEQGLQLDLTKDLDPPKDLYIEVRVVKEVGDIITEDGGVLKLELNSTHYLKISDVSSPLLHLTNHFRLNTY